ncbi:MAG: hypothetical protein ACTSX8_02375 [Alphaproteobacteria bacterium]
MSSDLELVQVGVRFYLGMPATSIPALRVAEHFVIHPTVGSLGWSVTHLWTGFAISHYVSREVAEALARFAHKCAPDEVLRGSDAYEIAESFDQALYRAKRLELTDLHERGTSLLPDERGGDYHR